MGRLKKVAIGLGSNLGNRFENLSIALELIHSQIGAVIDVSRIIETPPVGFDSDDKFLNMCAVIETDLEPPKCLSIAKSIEKKMGRTPTKSGYSSRPIDIDFILFEDDIIQIEELQIPHPRFSSRNFVLIPLNDLASNWIDPVSLKTVHQLVQECNDTTPYHFFSKQF